MGRKKLALGPEDIMPLVFNSLNTDLKAFIDAFVLEEKHKNIGYMVNKAVDLMGPELTEEIGGKRSLFDFFKYIISMGGYISNLRWFVDEKVSGDAWRKNFRIVPSHDVIAKFMLYQATVNFDTSLVSVFGQSSMGGPYNKVRLLEALVDIGADSIRDLSDYLDLSSNTVRKKLRSLAKAGIVDVETRGVEVKKGDLKFRASPKGSKILEECGTQHGCYKMARDIFHLMNQKPRAWFSVYDVDKALKPSRFAYNSLTSSLRALQAAGAVECNHDWFVNYRSSIVRVSEKGARLYSEMIAPVVDYIKSKSNTTLERLLSSQINEEQVIDSLYLHRREMLTRRGKLI